MKRPRRLRRFFTHFSLARAGEIIHLSPAESHHLKKTLRLKVGDCCLVANGEGNEVKACVEDFDREGRAVLKVVTASNHFEVGAIRRTAGAGISFRMCQAILQKGKMDWLVEKAQELGIDEVWPLETERTVAKIAQERQVKTYDRWQKIVRETVKQSGTLHSLKISPPLRFEAALRKITDSEWIAVFHPAVQAVHFRKWLEVFKQDQSPGAKKVNLFFGPEGGFSEREMGWVLGLRASRTPKVEVVDLGQAIWKADTAFLGVAAALRLLLSS